MAKVEDESPIQVSKLTHSIFKAIGPGILMAGAAVGVSHLVQATRAGAEYGYGMLWLLVLACVSKYPFMEFGPRYAAATGDHLITGYRKLSKATFLIFSLITLGTMFIIQSAVTIVTAGLAEQFFQLGWSPFEWCSVILLFCVGLLLIGRYPWLDKTMKAIITTLTICTLIAVCVAFFNPVSHVDSDIPAKTSYWNAAGIAFAIALMGWMPIPIDASVWHSIWVKERSQQMKYHPTMREARFDFDLGFLSAAFIGLLFFLMGVLVMYGSGIVFSDQGVVFSGQLIDLYGQTLGEWSRPLISIAALITMLSTTLAVSDAYPRVLAEIFRVFRNQDNVSETKGNWKIYRILAPAIALISLGFLVYLSGSFKLLVDFATGLSFLAAPILAWFNIRLISSTWVPEHNRPKGWYLLFSWGCFAFLVLFSILYLVWTFLI